MRFDLSKDVARIAEEWNQVIFDKEQAHDFDIDLYGPKGSGKTKAAQELANSHAGIYYVSFEGLSYDDAVRSFVCAYLPGNEDISSISDAVDCFLKKISGKRTLIIVESENSDAMREFLSRFPIHDKRKSIIFCFIRNEQYNLDHAVRMWHRSPAEFIKAFPEYNNNDAMRLQALTGGMMAVAKELDQEASYEDNVRRLLRFDSAFSTHLPAMLNQCFRTPESYYPIIKSMADGHCRLSEIAKGIGFPNNKCLNYIEALIENGFAEAQKLEGSKQSTYHLANSYYSAWGRYVYGKKMLQISGPDNLFQHVSEDIDEHITIPAFCDACLRFFRESRKEYLFEYRWSDVKEIKKAVAVKISDGSTVTIDYVIKTDKFDFNLIFPHAIDMKYTKEEINRVYEALDIIDSRYYAHTTVFSFTRFSDWCVEEAARNEWFHIVPVERLKY